MADNPLQSLQRLQAQYARNQQARQDQLVKLRKDIKKTVLVAVIGALLVALLADILSVIDVGWIVSWAIPLIGWVLVRRITKINKGGDAISEANKNAQRQLTVMRQRLRPALQTFGATRFLVNAAVSDLAWKARSYVSIFLRDTAITQLIELIPVIDILPLYVGQVVKMIIDQNIAYQKVKKLMPSLERTFQLIGDLEQFELQYRARQLATLVRTQQLRKIPRRNPAPVPTWTSVLDLSPALGT